MGHTFSDIKISRGRRKKKRGEKFEKPIKKDEGEKEVSG